VRSLIIGIAALSTICNRSITTKSTTIPLSSAPEELDAKNKCARTGHDGLWWWLVVVVVVVVQPKSYVVVMLRKLAVTTYLYISKQVVDIYLSLSFPYYRFVSVYIDRIQCCRRWLLCGNNDAGSRLMMVVLLCLMLVDFRRELWRSNHRASSVRIEKFSLHELRVVV